MKTITYAFIASLFATNYMVCQAQAVSHMDIVEVREPSDYDLSKKNKAIVIETSRLVSGKIGNHDYVDLGLPSGRLWATCNIGADKITEYGGYYAFAETTPKSVYNDSTYKWKKGEEYTFTSQQLAATDDAATANWNRDWRMPNKDEQKELIEGCTWEWTYNFNNSSIAGLVGYSKKNGMVIFLPAANTQSGNAEPVTNGGYGDYASSEMRIYHDYGYTYHKNYGMSFNADGIFYNDHIDLEEGVSVRAVVNK